MNDFPSKSKAFRESQNDAPRGASFFGPTLVQELFNTGVVTSTPGRQGRQNSHRNTEQKQKHTDAEQNTPADRT